MLNVFSNGEYVDIMFVYGLCGGSTLSVIREYQYLPFREKSATPFSIVKLRICCYAHIQARVQYFPTTLQNVCKQTLRNIFLLFSSVDYATILLKYFVYILDWVKSNFRISRVKEVFEAIFTRYLATRAFRKGYVFLRILNCRLLHFM